MCNQVKEVKVDSSTSNAEELRTRRVEARSEMFNALPAVIAAFNPIIDSFAKAEVSRHSTLGSRLAEIELANAERGNDFVNQMIDIAREFGIFDNIKRLMDSETDLQLAINQKEIEALEKGLDNDDDVIDDDDDDNDDDDVIDDNDGHKVCSLRCTCSRRKGYLNK
jgi:hypothetical protein